MLLFLLGLVFSATATYAAEQPPPLKTESVSTAHALFGQQCELCHEKYQGAPDKRCLTCHFEPPHNELQAFTPPCRSCHQEHQGKEKLAQVRNESCVECHAQLPTKGDVASRFAAKVTDFVQDHPEFAVSVGQGTRPDRVRLNTTNARKADRTTLIFPHEKHLLAPCSQNSQDKQSEASADSTPCLKVPKESKQSEKLTCKNCHSPDADGEFMKPVSYESHCKECHALTFGVPEQVAPHGDPETVRGFLLLTFSQRRETPPPAAPSERPRRLTRPVPSVSPINPSPGATESMMRAERFLYDTGSKAGCRKCHGVARGQGPLPQIVKTAILIDWLPHARFAHKAHRMLGCDSCHSDAFNSKKTADILLPGIQMCRECHRGQQEQDVQRQLTASTDCVECHLYHKKTGPVDWNGPFTVPRALTEGIPQGRKSTTTPERGRP
ncbi:MAG: cytochrome c3 family protein [Candidatus Binatia bacterium]